ncbi:protein-(glutamine-N5) methyltransferase, ribosomal protein L3-specific [Oxalobacter formigenes HOxBLS]|uniref:Ribosomal protein uL3 glutamine methyltransferase n=2 Tax=Oxalobacter paraformigenes TaxID=556268 RepID=C3X4A1_9BURK|nr:protein-(glutamine-N5) methyltransferase, ribosomal protein L3-specific [Oxalobacter paraformigenes]
MLCALSGRETTGLSPILPVPGRHGTSDALACLTGSVPLLTKPVSGAFLCYHIGHSALSGHFPQQTAVFAGNFPLEQHAMNTLQAHPFSTVRDLLRYAVTRFTREKLFFGHGSENAFDEAAYLILHTLSLPLDRLEPFLDATLLPEETEAVMTIIDRRVTERIPAAYLTNEAWLQGYSFYVERGVIIPRSFLAELIVEQFAPWVSDPDGITDILELCTGSGCLAIMLADRFANATVDAVELSPAALGIAQTNINRYGMKDRIQLHHADLYDGIPEKRYQLIVTNPPYVNQSSMDTLPPEYLHEPQMALAGGFDGMDIVRRIVYTAGERLTDDGLLIVEIGNEAENAMAAFPELELTWLSTSGGDDRVFLLTAGQLKGLKKA